MEACSKQAGLAPAKQRREVILYRWDAVTETLVVIFSSVTSSSQRISNFICCFKVTEEAGISLLPSHRGQLLNIGGNGILIPFLPGGLIPAISRGWHFSESRLQNSNEMISTASGQSWFFLWWYLEMQNYNISEEGGLGLLWKWGEKSSPFQEEHLTICKQSG